MRGEKEERVRGSKKQAGKEEPTVLEPRRRLQEAPTGTEREHLSPAAAAVSFRVAVEQRKRAREQVRQRERERERVGDLTRS